MSFEIWRTCSISLPPTLAQAYPSKPITVVVPYAPGGGVDIVTRIVTQELATALGQSVIVDNKPGASTNIGMSAVARAPADGYTLLTASPTLASNGALFKNLGFDPGADFTAIGKIGYAPLVIVVPVAYKGGSPAITDLLGGRISFMSINPLEVLAHIQAGKLRASTPNCRKRWPARMCRTSWPPGAPSSRPARRHSSTPSTAPRSRSGPR